MNIERGTEPDSIRVSGSLTVETVENAKASLAAHLAGSRTSAIHLSQVDACDAAGLQFLLAIQKTNANGPLTLAALSKPIQDAASFLGVRLDQSQGSATQSLETTVEGEEQSCAQ
jgi:ABC-type transporter Mla MlaB component